MKRLELGAVDLLAAVPKLTDEVETVGGEEQQPQPGLDGEAHQAERHRDDDDRQNHSWLRDGARAEDQHGPDG
jgi:hypothetical protein